MILFIHKMEIQSKKWRLNISDKHREITNEPEGFQTFNNQKCYTAEAAYNDTFGTGKNCRYI